jgi:hypothetical protein
MAKEEIVSLGRPTHYSDEIERKARQYLEIYSELGHAVPSVAGLSIYLGRRRTVLYQWAAQKDKEAFKDILDEINALQEQVALSAGLKGDYNSTIVKLLLGKHGYSDKAETQATISFESLSDEELNAKIKSLIS